MSWFSLLFRPAQRPINLIAKADFEAPLSRLVNTLARAILKYHWVPKHFAVRYSTQPNVLTQWGSSAPPQFMIVANHQAYADIPLLVSALPLGLCTAFMAKKELFEKEGLRWLFQHSGTFAVNREKLEKATLHTVKAAQQAKGWAQVLFPQGTRSPNGLVEDMKEGAAFFAKMGKVPVLVVGIAIAGEAPFEAKKGVKRPAAVVLHQWLPANYAEDTVPVLHERLLLAMRQAQAAAAALL